MGQSQNKVSPSEFNSIDHLVNKRGKDEAKNEFEQLAFELPYTTFKVESYGFGVAKEGVFSCHKI